MEGDEPTPRILIPERTKTCDPLGPGTFEAPSVQGGWRRHGRRTAGPIQRLQIFFRVPLNVLQPHIERRQRKKARTVVSESSEGVVPEAVGRAGLPVHPPQEWTNRARRQQKHELAALSQAVFRILTPPVVGVRPEYLDMRSDQWTTCDPAIGGGTRTILTLGS